MTQKSRPPNQSERSHPKLLLDELAGIAVDTNIYKKAGFRLRSQPLAALADVSRWGIVVLVPEIWRREVAKHTKEWAELRLNECRRATHIEDWGMPAQALAAKELHAHLVTETADAVSARLLEEHYTVTKAKHLLTCWEQGPRVLDDYFDARFPFEASSDKKSEFPDAFALATLEHWAETKDRSVLVVTDDEGCLAACDASKRLLGFKTLVEALRALSEADEARKQASAELGRYIATELQSEVSPLRKQVDSLIESQVENMEVEVEADSDVDRYDSEVEEVRLVAVHASYGHRPPDVQVLTTGSHELTFSWTFQVDVEVGARFYRLVGRQRSHSYHYGAPIKHCAQTVDVEAVVKLQTIAPLSVDALQHAQVRSVDFSTRVLEVDFGDVEPWEPYYEE